MVGKLGKRVIQGHAYDSTPNTVRVNLYIPTELFHELQTKYQHSDSASFNQFLLTQIRKGKDDNL